MMSNAAKGARESRQTIFFPPEEPPWQDRAEEPPWQDRALEPEHEGLAEPAKPDGDTPPAEPTSPAEATAPEAAAPAAAQDVSAEEPSSGPARASRYAWIREVGQAEDGAVFRAQEAETGNLVTVELLSQVAARDPKQVELFYLEAEAGARLQHPNIARAYKAEPFGQTHQRRASHLPDVQTLRELLVHGGWFDPARATRIIEQIADALAYAHGAGVLHLNLQPEHIWLGGDDWVFITGFGIPEGEQFVWARRLRASRSAPPYLSPEQLCGQVGGRASDLYALGVIFYEMLTDRVPFDSNDLDQLKLRHKVKTPRPPHEFNHDLTPEISDTVMALLTRDPLTRAWLFNGASGFKAPGVPAKDPEPVPQALTPQPLPRAFPPQPPRMTNPMPLSELVSEVGASPTALEPRRPAEELAVSQPAPAPQPYTPRQRSRVHYRSVLVMIGLVMLPWIVIFAIQTRGGKRNAHPPQSSGQPDQTSSVASAANHVVQGAGQSQSEAAASPVASGSAKDVSKNPVTAGPGDGVAADDMIVGPPAMPRGSTRTDALSSPPASEVTKAGNLILGAPVRRVGPAYPESARARRTTGVVVVEVKLNERGHVTEARAESGPEVFRESAVAAARKWQFSSTTLNGVPVVASRKITFHYDWPEGYTVGQSGERAKAQSRSMTHRRRGRSQYSRSRREG
jgi:serine/threonine-protein kinase